MFLFAKEEGVGVNVPFQIPSEGHFNIPRSSDILWQQIRKFGPLTEYVVSDPVHELIDSSASCFIVSRSLLSFREFILSL